jgi:hypothetical protein
MDFRSFAPSSSPIPSLDMCSIVAMGGNRWSGMHGESWRTSGGDLPSEYLALEAKRSGPPSEAVIYLGAARALPPPMGLEPTPLALWLGRRTTGLAFVAAIRRWISPIPHVHASGEVCTHGAQ